MAEKETMVRGMVIKDGVLTKCVGDAPLSVKEVRIVIHCADGDTEVVRSYLSAE